MLFYRVVIAAVLTPSMLRLLASMCQPTMHLTQNRRMKALVYDTSPSMGIYTRGERSVC